MIYFTPFLGGSGGARILATFASTTRTLGSTDGMTAIWVNQVNTFVVMGIPFPINFLGKTYDRVFINSRSFATFGTEFTVWEGISESNPPAPGIHVGAGSGGFFRRRYTKTEMSNLGLGLSYRVRYEGTALLQDDYSPSNMVWELTFYKDYPKIIDVVIGQNARGDSGTSGVTNGNVYLYQPATPTTSYRITST